MVNMIYATHIPKRERKRALRDVYAIEPVAPKFNPWSSFPITFDRRDHPTSVRHGGSAALVLDPIIDGFHLRRVLMDGGSSLNLLYQDTVRKMGINPSRIKPTKTTFKGVIPGVEARCTGSITLVGRTAFARFNVVPHYAFGKHKMPGPCSVNMVNGRAELPFTTEESTAALTARATDGTFQSNLESTAKIPDTAKGVQTTKR